MSSTIIKGQLGLGLLGLISPENWPGSICAFKFATPIIRHIRSVPDLNSDDYVYSKFSFSGKIVDDRDPKFTSAFLQRFSKQSGTRPARSAAYHPPLDSRSHFMNQAMEMTSTYLIADHTDHRAVNGWNGLLTEGEYGLNTSTDVSTGQSPHFSAVWYPSSLGTRITS